MLTEHFHEYSSYALISMVKVYANYNLVTNNSNRMNINTNSLWEMNGGKVNAQRATYTGSNTDATLKRNRFLICCIE